VRARWAVSALIGIGLVFAGAISESPSLGLSPDFWMKVKAVSAMMSSAQSIVCKTALYIDDTFPINNLLCNVVRRSGKGTKIIRAWISYPVPFDRNYIITCMIGGNIKSIPPLICPDCGGGASSEFISQIQGGLLAGVLIVHRQTELLVYRKRILMLAGEWSNPGPTFNSQFLQLPAHGIPLKQGCA
jgi:hypothetical protein